MKFISIIVASVFLFSNCSTIQRRLYSSTQVNNPSLKEKNDYSASVTFSTPSGFDFNGGYAITNWLGLIGGLYAYKNRDKEESYYLLSATRDSAALQYKHKGFHLGAGVFFPLSKKNPINFLSVFAGYTNGNFEMKEAFYGDVGMPGTPRLNFYKSDINRWFLQSSLNFYLEHVHQSFITRFNYAGYDNVITDYDLNQQSSFNLPPTAYPKWSSFLDFSFDTKIFFSDNERIGLQLFGSIATRLNRKDFNFYYYPFRLGMGIVIKSPLKSKESKK
jgi:hypothetical protein